MTDRADEIVPPVGIAQRLAAELEELLKWRSSVASALGRPSGVFYVDVPARIKKLAARVQELEGKCEDSEYRNVHLEKVVDDQQSENTRLREALAEAVEDLDYEGLDTITYRAALKERP